MRRPVTDIEYKMMQSVVEYVKSKGLDAESAVALVLLSRGDYEAERMRQKLVAEPEIDFDELLEWAVRNSGD